MHDCPDCYQACDCDGDDTWLDSESETCVHECSPEFDNDDDYDPAEYVKDDDPDVPALVEQEDRERAKDYFRGEGGGA